MAVSRREMLKTCGTAVIGGAATACVDSSTSSTSGSQRAPKVAASPKVALTMEFQGMCLLAANRAAKFPELGAVWALMPDTSRLTSGQFDPHQAMLTVAKSDTETFDAPDTEQNGQLIYYLTRHDVSLMVNGAAPAGPVTTETIVNRPDKTRKLSDCPPYDAPWTDAAFIADLDGILGIGNGTVAADFVKPMLDAESKVGARVQLTGGKLLGAAPADTWGRHVAWGFNDPVPGIGYSQALTDTVEFSPPAAEKVEVVIVDRKDNSQRRVVLKPAKVRVKVHNMSSGVNPCGAPNLKKKPSCRPHHFRAYYELLKNDPGHYPHPGPMFLCGTQFEIANTDPPVYCPPPFAFYE